MSKEDSRSKSKHDKSKEKSSSRNRTYNRVDENARGSGHVRSDLQTCTKASKKAGFISGKNGPEG